MPSIFHVIACATLALVAWSAIGWPVARRLLGPSDALAFAPIAGWAIHGAIAVLVFRVVPFGGVAVVLVAIGTAGCTWIARRTDGAAPAPRMHAIVWLAAAGLAAIVTAAVLPKSIAGAIALSDPIFDHAKVALIDDIVRLGMPPGNPFVDDPGHPHLSYYYLFHFTAAELAAVLPVTGWEADAAMTFFAAFTSLSALMAVAVRASGRAAAAAWTVVVAATASSRVVWLALFGAPTFDGWLQPPKGFTGWMFQSSWVPQHIASTTCVVLAILLLNRIATRRSLVDIVVAGLVVAAAFESSTWIGGIVAACIAVVLVPWLVARTPRTERGGVVAALVGTGVVALVAAAPFVLDQLASAGARQGGSPIAVAPMAVLGNDFAGTTRALLTVPAFWLLFMPIEFTAAYLCGLPRVLSTLVRGRARDAGLTGLAIAAVVALLAASWLVSTLADNNDLAWRAALMSAVLLTPFAAAGIATWIHDRRTIATVLAIAAIAIGLPEAVLLATRDLRGAVHPSSASFAEAPALWARVRTFAGPDERVANNPDALQDLTPWSVNLGWSLLADRRSCYATWELAQVYSSIPHDALHRIDDRFVHVFGGEGSAEDVHALATVHACRVAVVTPRDGAWSRDPFAISPDWRLVDERAGAWRIYRTVEDVTQ